MERGLLWIIAALLTLALTGTPGPAPAEPAPEPAAPPAAKLTVVMGRDGAMAFEPPMLTVRRGSVVELTLVNKDTAQSHSLVIPDLNAKSRQVMPGDTVKLVFTAAKAGSFRFYCDVPGHKDAGMVGAITVQP
ncbi:MAG TPA: cupredoxin domain-containing protein [Symbiobacteriaceae bacterium]|nr:cupredoxin domain-containing protein [Symbiobacteriaceae bacterium]